MIRIAFFAPLLHTGGTQRHLQQVLRLLDPARFSAQVFTLRLEGPLVAELRAESVSVTPLGVERRLLAPRGVGAVLRTARALRAEGVQIVHGYQWRPALIGALAARRAGVPLTLASKRSLTGDDRAGRMAWRLIGRLVDTVVVNAEALRTEAEAHGTRARWEMIPSGVDVDRFRSVLPAAAAKAALGLDAARPVVGTVGRLEERKGHEHLLMAARTMFALANGLRPQLLIVGDGPLRARLAQQAGELGIAASVHFTGALSDVRQALAAMDVFVLPSRAEGMSNALLEAMAAARPIVATAVGGTCEVLEPGAQGRPVGVLVDPDDADTLARETLRLLAEPSRAADLGSAALGAVEARFGARAMVARLEELYGARLAARAGEAA